MKLISKIASLSVGLTMAIGVGVALGSREAKVVKAATTDTYEQTSLEVGKEVVIVGTNANGSYAMGSAGGTSSAPAAISVTISGSSMSSTTDLADHVWVVGGSSSGWTFTKKNTSNLLYCTNANNGVRVGTNSNNVFTISNGYLLNSATSRYVGIYNSQDWRCYTSINSNISSQTFTYWQLPAPSGKTMGIRNNSYGSGPFEVTYGDTSEYHYALAYDVDSDESLKSGVSWDVSDESVIDYVVDGWTWLAYKPKAVGTTTITASCEGYQDVSTTITVVPGTLQSLAISGSMTKTSYYVGEPWSPVGFTVTATYDSGYVGDVTSDVAWSYSPSTPASTVTSVVATASFGAQSASSSAQTVSVSKTNPIQVLYTLSSGASVDVYGVYVGFLDGTGPVIMDGAYGIVIYNKSADVSGYTEGETILHVTGSISIYKGLYEVGSPTISVASGTYDAPDTPVVYATKGGETADYASRLTTVTGVPTVTSGSFDSDAGTADITMNFAVGSQTVQVFYKKAAQTADAETFAAMKAAVEGTSEITVKGFTGWYNGFQVQMNGYIPPAEGYTAEDFAQDLLDQTDAVCTGWEEGDDNHDALEAIWSNLASNDKYPSLPADQKTILAEAERDESGTVVEQAMARYDFLTGKYNLSNFINGRTPIVPAGRIDFSNDVSQNSSMIIIVSIAATSALAFTLLLVFKKKKQK